MHEGTKKFKRREICRFFCLERMQQLQKSMILWSLKNYLKIFQRFCAMTGVRIVHILFAAALALHHKCQARNFSVNTATVIFGCVLNIIKSISFCFGCCMQFYNHSTPNSNFADQSRQTAQQLPTAASRSLP